MAGLNDLLKVVRGQVKQCIAQVRGVEFDYTIFTDTTVRPPLNSTITIFGIPTDTEEEAKQEDGVIQEVTLDEFIFSREAFKIAGVFNRPTTLDFFFEKGDTLKKHNVRKIVEEKTGAFFSLFVDSKRIIRPKG